MIHNPVCGLDVGDARVLYDVFSVVVHLAPSPVVVRVPTVLPSYADAESGPPGSGRSWTWWGGSRIRGIR
ncbi:hypothetical protein ACGF8D_17025 [Streptomyces massasporeus]|uniref:hypothetical protein n=1 Tax=Streptomyces massasporeus TaxID=67324 RepID=UPI00372412D9